MAKKSTNFPKKFLWGASTSAHQVEGKNHNQWTVWELENAKALATKAIYQYGDLPVWPKIEKQAKNPHTYVSGRAVDHYNRYEEDFDLLQQLQMNAFRFGIEWSRIEPSEGVWDAGEIEHYRQYLKALRARNIEPIVTLFHFTLPIWFSKKGGFLYRSNVKYFIRFVDKVIDELGQDFEWVITINEPEVYAGMSYREGAWPPNVQSSRQMIRVIENLILAHRRAARAIHDTHSKFRVSMAYNLSYVYAGDDAWLSKVSANIYDRFRNHYILHRTIRVNDFIGLNFYMSERIFGYRVHNPDKNINDLGWDMQPDQLGLVLDDLAERYNKPIMITENGLADMDDANRQWWLAETIKAIRSSLKNGTKIIGYLHWSLLDNFEWDKGFWPRFGLVSVDYASMKRVPRRSALMLAKAIKQLRVVK